MNLQDTAMIKTCPQCGAAFSCNPVACWCSELPPVMPMLENAECYCTKCLNAIIKEKLAQVE